jgi:hypothetical protein
VGGEDANKFTLNGSELTFKAPEFQDGSDNTYRVNIKATWSHWARGLRTAEKTLTVTVHDGKLHITTADTFFENENTDIAIRLKHFL